MKQKANNNDPKKLEKDGIRSGDSQTVLSSAHETEKPTNAVLNIEVLTELDAILSSILDRIGRLDKSDTSNDPCR